MQSKTEEFAAKIEVYNTQKSQPKSFKLYEEYSQKDITETIRARKDVYENGDLQARKELETEVEIEVENFQIWLETTKKIGRFAAHYYSVSLKSLLLGLPTGIQIAQLFNVVMEKLQIL